MRDALLVAALLVVSSPVMAGAAETHDRKQRPPVSHAHVVHHVAPVPAHHRGTVTDATKGTHHHRPAALRHAGSAVHRPVAGAVAGAGAVALPPAALAAVVPPVQALGSVTGLKIPRFASLRSEEVNLRSGPGTRYPIQWIYKRRDLPVRIEREYDVWRLIEDQDGIKGWVHQATLIGTRTFTVVAPVAPVAPAAPAASTPGAAVGDTGAAAGLAGVQALRRAASDDAAPVAYLKPGVIGRILSCDVGGAWCHVSVHNTAGYLARNAMWGLLADETIGAS